MSFSRHLFALTASLLIAGTAAAQTIQINPQNKTLAINTSDEATAPADIAAINIGFEVFDRDADSVSATAGRLSQAITQALHKAGVEDKSIESQNQGLSRNSNFDPKDSADERAKKQFRFEQSWQVTTTPQNAAQVLRLAQAAGANQSGQIDWRLSTRKALQGEAASNALIKARTLATQMAEGMHVKLGALLYASNQPPETRPVFFKSKAGGVLAMNSAIAKEAQPLELRPQTIHEEATIYAVFAIE